MQGCPEAMGDGSVCIQCRLRHSFYVADIHSMQHGVPCRCSGLGLELCEEARRSQHPCIEYCYNL